MGSVFEKMQKEFNEVRLIIRTKAQGIKEFKKIGFGEKEVIPLGLEWRKIQGFDSYSISNLGTLKRKQKNGKFCYVRVFPQGQFKRWGACLYSDGVMNRRSVAKLIKQSFTEPIDVKRFFTVPQ